MKKSASGRSSGKENAKFVHCGCSGNPKLARRLDRPPLVSIQSEADQEHYIFADCPQKSRSGSISPIPSSRKTEGQRNGSANLLHDRQSFKVSRNSIPITTSLEVQRKSRSSSISPIPTSCTTHDQRNGSSKPHKDVLPKAPETKVSLSVPTHKTVFQSKQGPCAESTRLTQKAACVTAVLSSAAVTVSLSRHSPASSAKLPKLSKCPAVSNATTVPESTNVHRSQLGIKKRNYETSVSLKIPTTRSVSESSAVVNQTEIPKRIELRASDSGTLHDFRPHTMSSTHIQSKITETLSSSTKRCLHPPTATARRSSVRSSGSSGYSSVMSTKSDSTSRSAGRSPQVARLPSQKFTTLTQETLSFASSSKNSSTMFLAVSESRSSISPMGEVIYAAAQMGKVRMTRDTSMLCEGERPFVPMVQFIHDLDHGKVPPVKTIPISPCCLNGPPRTTMLKNDSFDCDGNIRKSLVKTTLMRNKKQAKLPLMYSPDYDEDIIAYCFQHRTRFLTSKEVFNTYVNQRARSCNIEWILKISNYVTPQIDSVFYMSVRLFDYAIIHLKLTSRNYQLAAIVAIWISAKYLADIPLKASKLFSLCEGKHSKHQMLSMEKRMIKSTNFCLCIADPLDFLHNYLKCANLDDDEMFRYGAQFVLECSAMFAFFAVTESPFLVAASLYLAYQVLKRSAEVPLHFVWYERNKIAQFVEDVLKHQVYYVITNQLEPAQKYSTGQKMWVTKHFFHHKK